MNWKFPYTEPQCKKYIYVKNLFVNHFSASYIEATSIHLFKSFDGKLSWKSTWEFEKPRIQSGFLCQVASCYKTLVTRLLYGLPDQLPALLPVVQTLQSDQHRRRQNQGSNCLSCCSYSSQIKGISGQNICVCRTRPKKVVFCILHVIKNEPG